MQDLLTALRAIAEPTRLRLLALCAEGELTVSELTWILGQSQPRVSRHLKVLVEAGLLERFREGSWVFHRLTGDVSRTGIARRLVDLLPENDEELALDRNRLAEVKGERMRLAAEYFRRNALQWGQVRSLYVDEREVEGALRKLFPDSGVSDLLDVGTGTGRMLEVFGPLADRAQGIDLSREMLTVARANLERAGLGNCAVRNGDMYQLPFPSASFDIVTIHQVLHFADHPARSIAEVGRVLRPGGRVLLVDFAPHDLEFLRTDHEHRRLGFSDDEVSAWFSNADLETSEIVHLPGNPLTVTIWMATRPEAAVTPVSIDFSQELTT